MEATIDTEHERRMEIHRTASKLARLTGIPAPRLKYQLGIKPSMRASLQLRLAMLRHALHQLVFPDAS